jgi:hypothetical protein
MSDEEKSPSESPAEVRATSGPTYVRRPDLHALHDLPPGSPLDDAITVLNDGAIAVFPTGYGRRATGSPQSPVYALEPGGALAVPTGQLFVRFAEGVSAASRAEALREAGYQLVDSPRYAPHTAWVRSLAGDIGAALSGVNRLATLPDVEHVEPQMLMARHSR